MIAYNYYVIKINAILMTIYNYKIENAHDTVVSENLVYNVEYIMSSSLKIAYIYMYIYFTYI